ncbi:MAG: TRZ/ATZ family hydrolase [Gammaproteobacteria bacterium]|nr:TRZ/ATZ family hydrolase [Gammaproteobacteria bacterium]
MHAVDLLVHARWLIPVEPEGLVLEHQALAIHKGRILAILPSAEAAAHYKAEHEIHYEHHAVLPGFVNAHTHAAMSLFRGLADDKSLMDWLQNHIWPAEARHVNAEFVREGTTLAMAEMLRSGTTCFHDMYFHADAAAQAVAQAGMRALLGQVVIDFPVPGSPDQASHFRHAVEFNDRYKHHPLIGLSLSPHAPYTVSDEALSKVVSYAEELDLPIQMHIHETQGEVDDAVGQRGQRPLARLDGLGLLSPRLTAVHMTALDEHDIALVAKHGVHVVHCPESNLKLASGFCPVAKLMQAGVNVALGTDGAASNNDLDMLGELRTAALVAKAVAGDAAALPAARVLTMATLNGAKALGLESECGSLVPGKAFDAIAINLDQLETQPLYEPISQIVYAASRSQIEDVWVAGRRLMKQRQLTSLDEATLVAQAKAWRERIAG